MILKISTNGLPFPGLFVALMFALSSGCTSTLAPEARSTDPQLNHIVESLMIPEASPEIFAAALPAKFRLVALHCCLFHQSNGRWPISLDELRSSVGEATSTYVQNVSLEVQQDETLRVGWVVEGNKRATVFLLTSDYKITFSMVPIIDDAILRRSQSKQHSTRGEAWGNGIGAGIRTLP